MQTLVSSLCGSHPRLVLTMLALHFIADFWLQGARLCDLKCQDWWEDRFRSAARRRAKESKERTSPKALGMYNEFVSVFGGDYRAALACHSLMWSIFVCAPALFIEGNPDCLIVSQVLAQAVVHYAIDNAKANWHAINLWQDQLLHLVQILFLATLFL